MIGTLGDLVFEVSSQKIKTFDDFKRKGSARWATHDVLGKKPVKEFIGPGLEAISFTMQLSSYLGINPLEEINKLRELRDKGIPLEFALDGTPISDNLWVIDDLSEAWKQIDNNGKLLFAGVDVSLSEYAREKNTTKNKGNAK